jgi:glyoxylase-like metal-dependent hydrolase (beta-lactamase superfamily II)
MSPLYSRRGINLGDRVRPLPADGTVLGMAGWHWVPTPGHSPGHVSFFREEGRVLIAGDAFVTTKQESALAVMTGRQEVRRPPAYFTTDWGQAKKSVQILAALNPWVAATGHGVPMCGPVMRAQLDALAENFDRFVPSHGRYVRQPARADETGTTYIPPAAGHSGPVLAAACLGVVALGAYLATQKSGRLPSGIRQPLLNPRY